MKGNSPLEGIVVAGSPSALESRPRRVLDERDVELLADVSARLMHVASAKAFPDVMSFAFWCRKGHLHKLVEERSDLTCNVGRGLSFHVSPSNVPVNFAFSWAFALLAGNSCVVRVPSRPFPQVDVICTTVNTALKNAGDERTAFVSYDSAGDVTSQLSAIADVRVLWGGDATVSRIRRMASKPRCVDVAFADRYSVAIIDARAVSTLDADGLRKLAEGFYNDTYLMDQNACSSPMTVAWLHEDDAGKARFWQAVRDCAVASYDLQAAIATDKYVQFCRDAMDGRLSEHARFDGWLDVISLEANALAPGSLGDYRGKGGYFYEVGVGSFVEIASLLSQPCQTVTYFGCNAQEIRNQVIGLGLQGVDRIVPVGKGMDINVIWDGMDLLSMMSRKVDVR